MADDLGERMTEAEFRRLQKKVKAIYQQAYEDIYKKQLDFVRRHERREAKYRAMVKAGTLSKKDFDAWMRGQVFQGKQWELKRKQMEKAMLNADRTAMELVNGSRLNVFADNANYIGYELEDHGHIDTSFNLYDADTVERMIKEEPDLLPPKKKVGKDKAYQWYNRQIQTAATQGIIQGETIKEIAKRIAKQTGETTMNAMLRNARTMYTGAQNAGRIEGLNQAQRLGIRVKKKWLATLDGRTRDSHRDLDGQVAEVDEPFKSPLGPIMYPGDSSARPENVWNCFIGQTKVASDSEIVRSYKHDYSGELIVIKTARGVGFTCTPNHPILTPRGWVGANRLNEGDNILIAGIGNGDTLGINPDVDHVLPRLDALHEFFNITFSERAAGLSVDFHGDRATANVEVVSKERFLMDDGNASSSEMGDKFQFKHSDTLVLTKRHLVPGFRRVHITALRLVRRAGKPLSFFGAGLSHAIKHGFRTVSRGDTAIFEPKCDSMPCNVQFLGQGLDGFSGQILVDNVVNINVTTVSHIPVFNLQTRNGYYFVNDIIAQNREKCNGYFAIAHNCRCTLTYAYPEYPSDMQRRDNETGEIVGNMTYREWEESKRQAEEETPKQFVLQGSGHEWSTREEYEEARANRQDKYDEEIAEADAWYQKAKQDLTEEFGGPFMRQRMAVRSDDTLTDSEKEAKLQEIADKKKLMDERLATIGDQYTKKYDAAVARYDAVFDPEYEYNKIEKELSERQNLNAVNPHYFDNELYTVNCQRCAVALEMREQGYDVEALPAPERGMGAQAVLNRIFGDAETLQFEGYGHDNTVKVREQFKEWGEGSRGIISINRTDGGGHVFNAKYKDGKFWIQDSQIGAMWSDEETGSNIDGGELEGLSTFRVTVLRTDNVTVKDIPPSWIKNRGEE